MIYANVHAEGHSNNSMFLSEDGVHRYNPTYTPRMLRQAFLDRGIELNTPDINRGRTITFDLFFEGQEIVADNIPKYLIALENPNINKLNVNSEYCLKFNKVFAWDIRLSSLPNVQLILIPHPMQLANFPGFAERDIFSCLINANKAFKESLPSDLYLERIKTIRWYEKNKPDMFQLYGMGWDKSTPAFSIWGRMKRGVSRARTKLLGQKPFPSYRGEVKDKGDVLKRSKFSYCYENSRDLSNYITEKVLDSLVNGCVPVYWGADNVLDYLPEKCFIDRRKFNSTAAVHEFLLAITEQNYAEYQRNIFEFLKSEAAIKFSSEYFASYIVENILNDLKTVAAENP